MKYSLSDATQRDVSIAHIHYLDGLRGLGALVVVFSHFVVGFYPALFYGSQAQVHVRGGIEIRIANSPLNLIYGGNLAVCIFFVLSGYVLTYKFFREQNWEILRSGVVRRYFRLAIPALFSLLVAYIFMTLGLFHNQEAARITKSDLWLDNLWKFDPHFLLMLKQGLLDVFLPSSQSSYYLAGRATYNIVLWTMSFEFAGSMLAFALAALLHRVTGRYWIYIILSMLLFFLEDYYSAFVMGVMLADLFNNNERDPVLDFVNRIPGPLLLLAGLALGSYPLEVDVSDTFYGQMNFWILRDPAIQYHVLGSFLIMLALLNSRKMQDFFSGRSMAFLGKISFSLYLLHLILMCSFSSYLFLHLHTFLNYHLSVGIAFLATIPILLTLSWIMYRLVDLNSVKFSRHLYRSIFVGRWPVVSRKMEE